jgi:diaminopimelate decarboxylase
LAVNIQLPKPVPGDYVIVHDAGANTLSLYSRHCSRPAPAVYAFRAARDGFYIVCVKEKEKDTSVLEFWK